MTALQTPRPAGAPDKAELRRSFEEWFTGHGVPHFMHRYSGAAQVPDLLLLLCVAFAFELGAAPWLELTGTQLLVAPLALLALTRAALPALELFFDLDRHGRLSWRSLLVRIVVLLLVAVVLWRSRLPSPYSDAWVNFAVILVVCATCTVLFSRTVWAHDDPGVLRLRRRLVLLLLALIVVFAVEGSAVDSFNWFMYEATGSIVPQALPALVLVAVMLALALRAARETDRRSPLHPLPDRTVAFSVIAVPVLLLVLAGETAVLPHAGEPGWQQAGLPLALAGLGIVVAAMLALRASPECSTLTPRAPTGSGRRVWGPARLLALLAPLFVLSYPAITGFFLEVDAFGRVLSGFDAFAFTAGVNLVYLALAWVVVAGGLDRIFSWAAIAAWRNTRSVAGGMVRGLPLLVIFAAFIILQAELWEVVVETSTGAYCGVVGVVLALTVGFALASSQRQLEKLSTFETWKDVCDAVSPEGGDAPPDARVPKKLAPRDGLPVVVRVRRLKWLNAQALMTVYQGFVFFPVTIAAGALYWILGRLAVPPPVAGEWVYGDQAPPSRGEQLALEPFLDQPWTRVAVMMAAFSALYLAVQVLSNPAQRDEFFAGTDRAIRQRLAVRAAYLELVPKDPERDTTWWERFRRLSHRAWTASRRAVRPAAETLRRLGRA